MRLPERARALTVPGFKSPGSIRDAKIFSPQLHAKRVAPRHVAAFDARVSQALMHNNGMTLVILTLLMSTLSSSR